MDRSFSEFLGVFRSWGRHMPRVAAAIGRSLEAGQALWFLVLSWVGHGSREPILPVAPPTYILYATPVFIAGSKRIHEGSLIDVYNGSHS